MDKETQAMFTILDRAQKSLRGIDENHLEDARFVVTAGCYEITVMNHDALRTMIKRLNGPFTIYLRGTDGWSIDVTRKSLLELLYCDQSKCGMGLSCDGQVAEVTIFENHTSIDFKYVG